MKHEYTRIVTDRVHNLLSAGKWDFWIDFGSWRKKLLASEGFSASEFAPLTMKHDGVYFALLVMAILLGLSATAFAVGWVYVWAANTNVSGFFRRHVCRKTRKGAMTVGKNHLTLARWAKVSVAVRCKTDGK